MEQLKREGCCEFQRCEYMAIAADPTSRDSAFDGVVHEVVARPPLAGARLGVAIHDVTTGQPIYEFNARELFAAASTTKIPTAAFALSLLGPEFRFRTRLVRTGECDSAGTVCGDLVLVASGDPNLSGRITPDGKLDFKNVDHSMGGYGASLVSRDPLQVIESFADGAYAAGIRRITGTVVVDTQLFGEDYREPGTATIVSAVAVNDNLIDIVVTAGRVVGEPLSYRMIPQSGYVRLIDRARTGERGDEPTLIFSGERQDSEGVWSVEVTGSIPAESTHLAKLAVQSPARFTRTLLLEALAAKGVVVEGAQSGVRASPANNISGAAAVVEHVSPPLAETVKVLLKVSQNLHAEMLIPVIGANLCGVSGDAAREAGYACAAELLDRWGLDMTGACQGDAAGSFGFFSPDFMCRLLVRIVSTDIYEPFVDSLPVMGRDGTLWDVQPVSAAAGHVRAKTGTIPYEDRLQGGVLFVSKGLAGYVNSKSGRALAFTLYLTNFYQGASSQLDPGQLLGELAGAIYEHY